MVCSCAPKTGTPINAILLIAISGCLIAFFWDLDVLSSLLSRSKLFIFMMMAVALLQRKPKFWGVPLVAWLPSLSVATNIFLMGSLRSAAFYRFGICTGVMLTYYVFFGLHAAYDTAHQKEKLQLNKMKENAAGS
ncbi:hypothetical protein L6164_017016 [Bauhinia variegata]|uniref:Uncharacterized protein n=1 Tax=Bauhinia variegata TaxID=167791 RepID=A0ACB9N6N3_BAUVA|nr:hypothetical protein L6164_017016 [Bauhinia variegata]